MGPGGTLRGHQKVGLLLLLRLEPKIPNVFEHLLERSFGDWRKAKIRSSSPPSFGRSRVPPGSARVRAPHQHTAHCTPKKLPRMLFTFLFTKRAKVFPGKDLQQKKLPRKLFIILSTDQHIPQKQQNRDGEAHHPGFKFDQRQI